MKKILVGVAGGFVILLAYAFSGEIGKFVGRTAVENYRKGEAEGAIEKAQEMAAIEIRKQLPVNVDEVTTLQNAISAGTTLIYHYRIAQKKENINIEYFKETMQKNIINNVCGNENMKFVLDNGRGYSYVYVDSLGASIGEFRVAAADCK